MPSRKRQKRQGNGSQEHYPYKLYAVLRLQFIRKRTVQHNRADVFDLKRGTGDSSTDIWKRGGIEKLRI